jgi:hypothetical protein
MCGFLSAISDGEGTVHFFKPDEVVKIMTSGNPEKYDFNSHTSLMHSLGIKGEQEDTWAKWEYNPETKELKHDGGGSQEDKDAVLVFLNDWFRGKDIGYLRNLYGGNSGDWNPGHGNSGDWNSGDWNSGHGNSGNRNSGNGNSGDGNSGNRNSGYWNSGDGNSGNGNSGDGNSGNRNSGYWNSGDGVLNTFCSERSYLLFNKPCKDSDYQKINDLSWSWSWFWVTRWVSSGDMTEDQKKAHPDHTVTGGFLEQRSYKDAWKDCPKDFIEKVKKLRNFDNKVFAEITGLKV